MNTLITMIGFGLIVASFVTKIITLSAKKATNNKSHFSMILLIVGIATIILASSFTIIPTGYSGVRTTFGQISQETMPQGFNFKIPFVQDIHLVNNKQQDVTIEEQIWGETKEKTPVYASQVVVTYQVMSNKSAWIFANVTDTDVLITPQLVASATKSAMTELPADNVTQREIIEPKIKERLTESINEKYGEDTIRIIKVVVNQMDFEESYNQAISAKSIARQRQEQQAIENQTAIEKAEAEKKVSIANAEAEAEKLRIKTEAEAKALKIAAEAEAEANKVLMESLSDEILKAMFYENWNGELPNIVSDGSIITDIMGTDNTDVTNVTP
jgi:regulator of protease activity HflC (stomatin/prohibitin superfamily)